MEVVVLLAARALSAVSVSRPHSLVNPFTHTLPPQPFMSSPPIFPSHGLALAHRSRRPGVATLISPEASTSTTSCLSLRRVGRAPPLRCGCVSGGVSSHPYCSFIIPPLLQFNGGPGCSSLEGAFQESGPLWTAPGGKTLQRNEFSWNKFAHTLFLEAPAGVGFSYADTPAGTSHTDTSTAVDNHAALVAFYQKFPELIANELVITGESYAGICAWRLEVACPWRLTPLHRPFASPLDIPMLAFNIHKANTAGVKPRINLSGLLVGNGCIGQDAGVCGRSPYGDYLTLSQYHGHGFISNKAMAVANAACGNYSTESPACRTAVRAAANEVGRDVDVYDIYSGVYGSCVYGASRRPVHPDSAQGIINALHAGAGNECTNDADLSTYVEEGQRRAPPPFAHPPPPIPMQVHERPRCASCDARQAQGVG